MTGYAKGSSTRTIFSKFDHTLYKFLYAVCFTKMAIVNSNDYVHLAPRYGILDVRERPFLHIMFHPCHTIR